MYAKNTFRVVLFGMGLLAAQFSHAGLVIETLDATDVASFTKITPATSDTTSTTLSSYAVPGGNVKFWYGDMSQTSNALVVATGNYINSAAAGDAQEAPWWDTTYPIFTTGLPSDSTSIWMDLSHINAYGVHFQMAANANGSGWFDVYKEDGTTLPRESSISVSRTNWPGFQVTNDGGSCERITKVNIDPEFTWGIFNVGIDTVGNNCVSVPEPSSLSLLGLALLGLGLTAQARKQRTSA